MSKPTLREAQEMSLDIEDAKTPFKYIVTRDHVWGSKSKYAEPFGNCVQENAILSMPGVLDCKFHKTIAYVIFKGNPHKAKRYTPSQDGKEVAEVNDNIKKGKKELLNRLAKPMELWLEVPRHNRSLKYLRSPEMQRIRKESKERRAGETPRDYDSPTKKGFRNGTGRGLAHMWKVK